MNVRHVLAASIVLAAAGSAAVLVQELRLQRNTQNIVAMRIGGAWTLDATLTRRLSPETRKDAPEKLMFAEDEGVLKSLLSAQSRFANKQIFSAGTVAINGGKPAPYVLTNDHGNMSVVIFNGGEGSPTATSLVYTMSIGYATNPRNDVLFLGNEALAQSALAYVHEGSSPIAATATPASAPK
jgi:hypothetical protein